MNKGVGESYTVLKAVIVGEILTETFVDPDIPRNHTIIWSLLMKSSMLVVTDLIELMESNNSTYEACTGHLVSLMVCGENFQLSGHKIYMSLWKSQSQDKKDK